MDALKQKFFALDKRDQGMLCVLVIALSLYILVGQIWLGLMDERDRLQNRINGNDKVIAWMQGAVSQIKRLQGGEATVSGSTLSLSQLAQQAAKKSSLRMSRFQPKGDEAQVWLDKAAFNQVLAFMATLEQQYAVQVISVSINSANQAGLVNARIKFKK